MKKRRRRILGLLTAGFLMTPAAVAIAQSADVEVNLDVLQDYKPPTTFEPQITMQAPFQKRNHPPLPTKKPPLKALFSLPKAVPLEKVEAQRVDSTNDKSIPVISTNIRPELENIVLFDPPPIPRKRPAIIHASKSFVKEARQDFLEQESAKAVMPAEKPKIDKEKYIDITEDDALGAELLEPSAQDVLSSIADNTSEPAPLLSEGPENTITISLGYQPGVLELTDDVKKTLHKEGFSKIKDSPGSRIEIHAYASAEDNSQSTARRTALARALEIRDFLVENKFDPARINLRPFGSQTDKTPADRVEIIFIE